MEYLIALAADPAAWVALATLVALEIVLGIDNVIFIAIVSNKLPAHRRKKARTVGLLLALGLRIALLSGIAWVVTLTQPLVSVFGHAFSGRDLILLAGGLFLMWKATKEIHERVEHDGEHEGESGVGGRVALGFAAAIGQIIVLDLVFSLDSIITAVGMTEHVPIMVGAVLITVGVMMIASGPLAEFVNRNPTVVMLALGFLIMIGMTLIAEAFGAHVEKGYVYAAMAFSSAIEALNMISRRKRTAREAASPKTVGAVLSEPMA